MLVLQKRDLKICTLKKQKSSQVTYVSILFPNILSSHWLFSKHSLSCLPRNFTLVGQQLPSTPTRATDMYTRTTTTKNWPTQLPILIKSPVSLLAATSDIEAIQISNGSEIRIRL